MIMRTNLKRGNIFSCITNECEQVMILGGRPSKLVNDKTVIINISFSNILLNIHLQAVHCTKKSVGKSVSNVLHNVCVELLLLQSSRAHEADDRGLRMRPPYSHSDIPFLVNLPRKDFKKNQLFFQSSIKRTRCTSSPLPHRGRTELQKIGRETNERVLKW